MDTRSFLAALVLGCSSAIPAWPEVAAPTPSPRVRLDETIVTGNQELPKVLYIVPWQDTEAMPQIGIDPSVIELDVFRTVDPSRYRERFETLRKLEATSPAH